MSDEKIAPQSDPQIEELPVEAVSGEEAENVTGGLLPASPTLNTNLNPSLNLNPNLNTGLNR